MKLPIVIAESDDISVHPSVEHVELDLEAVDVRDGIYIAYDSEGYLLDLTVELVEHERRFLWFKWTDRYEGAIINEHNPPIDRSTELRSKLMHFLTSYARESEKELRNLSLEELIRRVGDYMPWRMKHSNR